MPTGLSPRKREIWSEVRHCRGIAAMAPGSASFFFRLFCRPKNAFHCLKSDEMSFCDLEPNVELSKSDLENP
jgi:hypothetical protein